MIPDTITGGFSAFGTTASIDTTVYTIAETFANFATAAEELERIWASVLKQLQRLRETRPRTVWLPDEHRPPAEPFGALARARAARALRRVGFLVRHRSRQVRLYV